MFVSKNKKATLIDLQRIVKIKQPTVKIDYELQEIGAPNFEMVLKKLLKNTN